MPLWNQSPHTYEELREIVVDILLGRERTDFAPNQWAHVTDGVRQVIARRAGVAPNSPDYRHRMHAEDAELVRNLFLQIKQRLSLWLQNGPVIVMGNEWGNRNRTAPPPR